MRYNPFNPQNPPRADYFVGRVDELRQFEQDLLQTIHGSPMNMSITGNRGMGKTSLLMKMEEIARKNKCLVFRMSNYESLVNNISELTNYLILGLKNEFYADASVQKKVMRLGEWATTLRPVVSYKGASLSFEEKRLAAQTILRNNFLTFWKKVEGEYPAVVLLIDEAESLERIEGALSFLREVFQRLSHEAKYMVVLCGKLNFPERMSESFSPLNRFFPASPLTAFTEEETFSYISKTLKSVNVVTDDEVKKKIFEKSEGHPYVLVKVCNIIFNELEDTENKITAKHLEKARVRIIIDLGKDFFNPMLHPVSPKAKNIAFQLLKIGKRKFIFAEAVKSTNMKRQDVAPYIQELVRKGCLNKPERATYEFFHQLFIDFLKKRASEV
ncbi:ATP-binding protein [Candidatus Micrarchaeota archaeon]|nr:ATP-binding protein [Candidatus Micrarchaeota archaeon]